LPVYKTYAWDGSTYTEISNEWKGSAVIPVLALNPDQSLIYQGLSFSTIEDYKSTILAVGQFVAVEKDGDMIWYGVVASNKYNYNTRMNEYNVDSYFEKLKDNTPVEIEAYLRTTLNSSYRTTVATSLPVGLIGTLTYYDITITGLLNTLVEGFLNMTVVYDLGTNLTTILNNLKVNNKNILYWKSKFSSYELTSDNYNGLDLFTVICRAFGLRAYISDTETVTIKGSDAAPGNDTFSDDYIFGYDRSAKSAEKFKQVFLKQKEFLIRDVLDFENTDYYYSVGVLFSYNTVKRIFDNGSDIDIEFYYDHKLDVAIFKRLKFLGYKEGTYDITELDWESVDSKTIKIYDQNVLDDVRHFQKDDPATWNVTSTSIVHSSDISYSTLIIAENHRLALSQVPVRCSGAVDYSGHTSGDYTYEAGTGNPSADGLYRVQNNNTIIVRKTVLSVPDFTVTVTDSGTIEEILIYFAAIPYFIENSTRTTYSGKNVIAIKSLYYGLQANEKKLTLRNTAGIDGDYYLDNTLSTNYSYAAESMPSGIFYILDQGQELDEVMTVRIENEDKEISMQLTTAGREDQNINLNDYLTIYRPSYATDSTWKDIWKVVSLQETVYTLLLKAAIYAPWWFYYFSPYYQAIYSESIEIEDLEDADKTKVRNMQIDIGNKSISIDQDEP
jgi:hypothetical protein